MQEGWYYRSLANEELNKAKSFQDIEHMDVKYEDTASEDDNPDNSKDQNVSTSSKAVNFKSQYRFLKRKLKFLIYENEFFQDALRSNQRRLLKVSRDRAFLLDRLLQYEKPDDSSSESEETESSEEDIPKDSVKRKKVQEPANTTTTTTTTTATENGNVRGRKRKANLNTTTATNNNEQSKSNSAAMQLQMQTEPMTHSTLSLGAELEVEEEPLHISAAEVERHLQSKPPMLDLLTERAPATVPTEMFSVDQ